MACLCLLLGSLERVRNKEGDFVECGVNRGGLSRAVMHYVDFERLDKQFWLLDTFEGPVDRLIRKTNEVEAFCWVATILATRTWWRRFVRFGGAGLSGAWYPTRSRR